MNRGAFIIIFTIFLFLECKKEKSPYPPKIFCPDTAKTNRPITFAVVTTDPNKDEVAYLFDFGDGSKDTWSHYYASGETVYKTHIYLKPGNYNVTAKAKDTKNNESQWSNIYQILILSQTPNPPSTPEGPIYGYINTSYTFSASATDPDGDSIAIRFDWGNGQISNWSDYVSSGSQISMSNSYSNEGTFYIRAQAKDIYGNLSDWSSPFIITIIREPGWITIMTEDFEGEFPGTKWSLSGNPTWDKENYRVNNGNWSGWCAGSTRHPSQGYASYMNAWMIYGPFSLAGATDAYMEFSYWLDTEDRYDSLFIGASINGRDFYGYYYTGRLQYWSNGYLDLTNVPVLGNLCGKPQVWIAFRFKSDASVEYEGAYLDDIILKKYINPKTYSNNTYPKIPLLIKD